MAQMPSQLQGVNQEPAIVQLDPKCLHSALKEFFDPLRTNDSRADFFAVYHKESGEFDRDYVKKYDENLSTSLIFAGLFSAVSSAFITSVQSKLEPDPNEMTAAYMQILIHTMNNTLFPDADPSSVTWTGPPPKIVAVQSLLYASLATSLFAAFLAMLGKQWVNRYIRNRGGSAADKSRDRQRKLDGLKRWHFHLAIEGLPVLLQFALLLLGCALSLYLWTISRTVAGVILAFTLFGVTSYIFFTLVAILYYNCPYQTPPSILIRTLTKYVTHSSSTFAHSLRSLATPLTSIYSLFARNLRQILSHLCTGVCAALQNLGFVPGSPDIQDIPLAAVAVPSQFLEEMVVDWEVCKTDAHCISWVLDSTTDMDVIFSTVHFAADTIWYPEISGALSPHILADLFLECLLDGRVIPGKLEHVSMIGMALASVLSIQLSVEPEREDLQDLCHTIHDYTDWVSSSEPTFLPGVIILRIVTQTPEHTHNGSFQKWEIFSNISDHLPTTHKLCLSRLILQTIWQWRCMDPTTVFNLEGIGLFCKGLMANGDHIIPTLKINCFLIMAISLGLQVANIYALFIPNDRGALGEATLAFHQQLQTSIMHRQADPHILTLILSALSHLNPFRAMNSGLFGFEWMTGILNSEYPEDVCYQMAGIVVQLLGKEITTYPPDYFSPDWVPPLLGFLSLSEKFYTQGSPPDTGFTAFQILLCHQADADFGPTLLPILMSTLLQNHPLQSRSLALKVFHRFMPGWFSKQMKTVSNKNLDKLLQAVGDPFQFPDLPLQYRQPEGMANYDPMMVIFVLIEFSSSKLWQSHLSHSNFDSCEEVLSTEEGRRTALRCLLNKAIHIWPGFLHTPAKIIATIKHLEELQCLNTAEVVILWAWTTGVVDAAYQDAWRLIGCATFEFYQTHGIGRLTALKQHIIETNKTIESDHLEFLLQRVDRNRSSCKVEGVQHPVRIREWVREKYLIDLHVSQVCQLGRLYHLFGYNPTTWKEAVAIEVDGEMDVLSGGSVLPAQFTEWLPDYP